MSAAIKTWQERLAAQPNEKWRVELLSDDGLNPQEIAELRAALLSCADDFKAWRAQPEVLAATWSSNAADLQLAYEAGRARASEPLSDGKVNELTMDLLGKWPSFQAQSWACKVVHAVNGWRRGRVE